MQEGGFIEQWRYEWWNMTDCDTSSTVAKSTDLRSLVGVYAVLGVCAVSAFLILIIERIVGGRHKKPSSKKYTEKGNNELKVDSNKDNQEGQSL